MAELSVYDNDPTLYLFTSLTAGSSHIVTATSRIETILKANKIPFKGVDTATDELARKLYGRRASGKKLPLLVKEGFVIADLEQVEEWNEFDELHEALGVDSAPVFVPAKPPVPTTTTPAAAAQKENIPTQTSEQNLAIRQLGAEAAKVAASKKAAPEKISTTNPLLAEKISSPAASTPTKGEKGDASGILSPRSIPLPATPNPASATTEEHTEAEKPNIPKLTSKPIKSPPSMHVDAANPDLAAPPVSTTTAKSPSSSSVPSQSSEPLTSPRTEFNGGKIGMVSDEEIKQIEEEQTIPEVSSSEEEEDDEDEDEEDKTTEAPKAVESAKKEEPVTTVKDEKASDEGAKTAEKTSDKVED